MSVACGGRVFLLLVIVLVIGGLVAYPIWHREHAHPGLVKEQAITRASGSEY